MGARTVQEKIEVLKRRADYLKNKINSNCHREMGYEKQEENVLRWAINTLEYFLATEIAQGRHDVEAENCNQP